MNRSHRKDGISELSIDSPNKSKVEICAGKSVINRNIEGLKRTTFKNDDNNVNNDEQFFVVSILSIWKKNEFNTTI